MGIFHRSKDIIKQATDLKLEDIIPTYDHVMDKVMRIGEAMYRGYLRDELLTGDFAYLKGFHDYYAYTSKQKTGELRRRKSLRVPKFTSEHLNKLIFTENVCVEVTTKDDNAKIKLQAYLDKVLHDNDFWNKTAELSEVMWNIGGKIEKPTVKDGKVHIEFILGSQFWPLEWDNSQVYSGVFVSRFQKHGYFYKKLTYYTKKGNNYEVEKQLFKSKHDISLGERVSYKELYSDAEKYTLTDFKSIPFTYTKPRVRNNIQLSSPLGIPIWWNAIDVIADIDLAFDYKNREVKNGGRTKVAPSYMFKEKVTHGEDGANIHTWFDPDDETFKSVNEDPMNAKGILDLTSPIRHESFIAIINNSLNLYAVETGFSVGDFVFDGSSANTATEVRSRRESTYKTKVNHEKNLGKGYKNLFMSILELARASGLLDINLPDDLAIDIKFDDSIVIDDEKIAENMSADAEKGRIPDWRVIAFRYGLTETEAKQWVQEAKETDDMSAFLGIEAVDRDVEDELEE